MGATRAAQKHPNSIPKLRGRKGWTVKQLADRVFLDEWTVRQLETGKMKLHAGHVTRFSEAFDVLAEDIIKPCKVRRNQVVAQRHFNENLDRGRGAKRWAGKLPVPKHSPHLVRELFNIMNEHKLMITDVAADSGVSNRTISDWRYTRSPSLSAFEAVLNNMGYDLQIVPQQEGES